MSEIKLLLEDLEKLRKNLEELIERRKGNLQDPDIIIASQMLNSTITKYNDFIKDKLK
ncbi:MAG: Spo0E family sporulation regulatory protein-aspartic acid phosphatase [Bacillota bacterium]